MIELPEKSNGTWVLATDGADGYDTAIDECRAAIEAAGVTVK